MVLSGAWALRKNQPRIMETIARQVLHQHEFGLLSSDVVMTQFKKKEPIHTPNVRNDTCFGSAKTKDICPTLYRVEAEGYFKTLFRDNAGAGEASKP